MNRSFKARFALPLTDSATPHYFALRLLPKTSACQSDLSPQWKIPECANPTETVDGYGNPLVYGYITEEHDHLTFELEATLTQSAPYRDQLHEVAEGALYLEPTEHLTYHDEFLDFIEENPVLEIIQPLPYALQCVEILSEKHDDLHALTNDLVLMLRYHGIPTRFVSGIDLERKALHIWIEIVVNGSWLGIDPRSGQLIEQEPFIKLADGRDYQECRPHRGVSTTLSDPEIIIQAHIMVEE